MMMDAHHGTQIKDVFNAAGEVRHADVLMGRDGRPRGAATIEFASPEGAAKAIDMYNGGSFNGRTMEVRYDKFA